MAQELTRAEHERVHPPGGPAPSRRLVPVGCAIGCGTAALILACAVAVLVVKGCPGEVARWTNRPEGRVVVRAGMTKAQVQQESTTTVGTHGDSGRFVDFELTEDRLPIKGITLFRVDEGAEGRVVRVSMFSANESWRDLLRAAIETEELLLANGWVARQPSVRTLTRNPREAAAEITESGALARAHFTYRKGDQEFQLAAGGLWSGIPWWRSNGARVFWRNMNYFPEGSNH